MAATRFNLAVHNEEGEPQLVTADQRDIAAFERAEKVGLHTALDTMPMVFFRFIGWHALRRTGQIPTSLKHPEWDAGVVEVELDPEGEQSVDPGQPEASAAG